MNYLITERQLEVLEIGTQRGRYDTNPYQYVFRVYDSELKRKHKIEAFKKYFSKELGLDIKKIGDNTMENFFSHLRGFRDVVDGLSQEFFSEDSISGFAYYIAENYFKMKKGFSISFIKVKDSGNDKNFYFFDSAQKIFVGMILTIETDDFPKKSYRVSTSAAVKSLIGQGYGLKMYLTVINEVDYLQSDTLLYTGSLRMWRDVLPKYVNVWAVVEDSILRRYMKQTPGKRIKSSRIEFFCASSHHDEIS